MQNVTENINVGKLLDNWDETHELTKGNKKKTSSPGYPRTRSES